MSYCDRFVRCNQLNLELNDYSLCELNPIICGMEENRPDSFWGPGFRSIYHLHFITGGKGIFENSKGTYKLGAGQGFYFIPGERVYYKADNKDPWTYIWFGFKGSGIDDICRRIGLSPENPVFSINKDFDILTEFAQLQYMKTGREYYSLSVLYRFFSSLDNTSDKTPQSKIEFAVNYILQNLSNNMSVSKIADMLNLDRRYFSRIFAAQMGLPPQQYIINARMCVAYDALKNNSSNMSVGDIARSVGYDDQLSFSKIFKKTYGLSPSDILSGKEISLTDY